MDNRMQSIKIVDCYPFIFSLPHFHEKPVLPIFFCSSFVYDVIK